MTGEDQRRTFPHRFIQQTFHNVFHLIVQRIKRLHPVMMYLGFSMIAWINLSFCFIPSEYFDTNIINFPIQLY